MKLSIQSTVSILGAVLLGTMIVSGASAQCGNGPWKAAAPAGLRQTNPSHGRARVLAASYTLSPTYVSDNDADDEAIVGMWHAVLTAKGNAAGPPDGTVLDNAMVTWHVDKTETTVSSRPPQDGNVCMGVWEKTGPRTYRLNHIGWAGYDTTNAPLGIGNPSGPTTIVEEVVVSADGKHFTGSFILEAHDISGNLTAHLIGVVTGTRVTINTTVGDLL